MNQKAEKFDLLIADLNKGGNSWFTKEEMTDDLHTVVYHGRWMFMSIACLYSSLWMILHSPMLA